MGNDPFDDFPAGCWLWGYTQPLQRFSSSLPIWLHSHLKSKTTFINVKTLLFVGITIGKE